MLAEWQRVNKDTTYPGEEDKDGHQEKPQRDEEEEDDHGNADEEMPPGVLLRHGYLWVPSRVFVDATDAVRFLEPINRCPRTPASEALYAGFEAAISQMLPLFRLLNVLPPRGAPAELQVICKAQRYTLQPGQCYNVSCCCCPLLHVLWSFSRATGTARA